MESSLYRNGKRFPFGRRLQDYWVILARSIAKIGYLRERIAYRDYLRFVYGERYPFV